LSRIVAKLVTRDSAIARICRVVGWRGWEYWCNAKVVVGFSLSVGIELQIAKQRSLSFLEVVSGAITLSIILEKYPKLDLVHWLEPHLINDRTDLE
jgi:hypothetical protein